MTRGSDFSLKSSAVAIGPVEERWELGLGVDDHRAELQHVEPLAVQADALLA